MKPVKNFLFAFVLVSAIAVNTPAGEQESPGNKPAPTPTPAVMSTSDEYPPVGSNEQAGGTVYMFFEALAALLSIY